MERIRLLSDVEALVSAGYVLTRGSLRPSNTQRQNRENPDYMGNGAPDALKPFRLASVDERTRRVRDVLTWAWAIYRRGDVSIVDAIDEAANGGAVGEYAKRALRRILLELNLPAWEAHPNRTRADVHRLFRKAINKLTPHRGGWQVSR